MIELAELVSRLTDCPIDYVANPRQEADENNLDVENTSLLKLGLEPITLENGLLMEVRDIAERYGDRCDRSKIPCTSKWRADARRAAN